MSEITKRLCGAMIGTLSALAASMASGAAGAEAVPEWQVLLEKIVNINSGTQNIEGLDAVRQVLIPEFEALGLAVTTIDLEDGHKLLSIAVPGATPEILLMGHIDTVFPKDSDFQKYELSGDRIFGPGVIDMKGGIVLMLSLLEQFKDSDRLGKFIVLINDDEEIGSPYSKAKSQELTAGVGSGLVFEPGLPDGAVVISQSGVYWLTLTVEGKASHAGLEPELGISACLELSDKVVRISKLSDYERKLSVNVGTLAGGTKPNVVCQTATASIDIRFVAKDDRDRTLAAIRTIADDMVVYNELLDAAPTAGIETQVDIPSLPPSSTERLFGLLKTAAAKTGQEVSGRHVGYVSDANQLAPSGMDLLVGLGPYGGGMHTMDEQLIVSTFDERLALTKALVEEILK